MFKKIKNLFKLNSKKRWIVVSFIAFLSILFVSLGSIFLIKNTKTSNVYQNGANITYTIKDSNGTIVTDKSKLEENKNEFLKRLELLYPNSNYQAIIPQIEEGTNNSIIANQAVISIDVTKINNNKELLSLKDLLLKKTPYSIIEKDGIFDLNNPKIINNLDIFKNAVKKGDQIFLVANSKNPSLFIGDKEYLIIKNLDQLIDKIKNNQELFNDFTSSTNKNNLFNFLFYVQPPASTEENKVKGILKTKEKGGIDSIDYLISVNKGSDYAALENNSELKVDFSSYVVQQQSKYYDETFYDLKNSVSDLSYNIVSSSFLTAKNGTNVFVYLLIAAGVILSLVTIFLVVNYGLLGFLNVISTALLIFLGLLMISVFRGDYDPLSILVIVVSAIFSLVLNFGFFERIKKEIKNGIKPDKAIFKANKLFFKSTFYGQLLQVIITLIIFFITPIQIQIFSSVLLIQTIFSFFISFVGLRWCIRLLAKTNSFENIKPWFIGVWVSRKKLLNIQETNEIRIQRKTNNPLARFTVEKNYLKYSLSFLIILIVLSFASVIAFATFGLINKSALTSFNLENTNRNRTVLIFNKGNDKSLTNDESNFLIDQIKKDALFTSNSLEIKKEKATDSADQFIVFVSINELPNNLSDFNKTLESKGIVYYRYILPNSRIQESILDSTYIALASIMVMVIFVLLRYKYPSALAVFVSMLIALPFFILSFVLFQIPISIMITPIITISILWLIINMSTILNRINEKMKTKNINILQKIDLKKIATDAIRDKIRELIKMNLFFIFILAILTIFVGVMPWTVTIPLIVFALFSFTISIFVLPFLYVQFEIIKIRRKRKRIESNFWDTEIVKEQVFPSFNDIK